MVTRRTALGAAFAGIAATAAGSLVTGGRAEAAGPSTAPHPLRRSRFVGAVGDEFRLGERVVRLEAVPARAAGDAAEDSFSLLFRDAAEPPLPEGTYPVEHPQLGTVALFLSPVGATRGRYEAVVNRLAR